MSELAVKLAKLDEDDLVITLEVRFKAKTIRDRTRHIDALMKLLDKRAASYKLSSFKSAR